MLTRFIAVAAATLISTAAFAVEVTGAGATFPQPIYMKWAEGYKKATSNVINYQGIGSGAGIKQIEAKTVNFGATDIPVKTEDLEKKGQVQFPMIVGGIVPIINLKDVDHLTLTTDILAKIYMEKIKRWNDKEIAELNPGVKLPDLPIIKIRRADGSGTTWNFTKFLSEANEDWKKKYGIGQTVEWVGGAIGAKGNDGVANNVYQTNGSIGYVEYAFAKQNDLTVADMIGKDGKKVSPGLKAFQTTWPMVATSYIVLNKENDNKEAVQAAIKFFEYGYAHDKDAEVLDYIPLTAAQKAESKKAWSTVN
ncbi:MAG: phosphate ABC transporter substrate-binding protein PstS [Gammaproteobacteria bacterium]|nr:phosphate ABC transporter substrate-binding protein PstS [Gammaproteobacteria bacterium]